jgi:ATP-dependent RNA helicase RhlE
MWNPFSGRAAVDTAPVLEPNGFGDLNLPDPIARAIAAIGHSQPTPIQARAIPLVLAGADVIGSAQTGTGKTAAFALPILARLERHRAGGAPRVLVLEPTRELALQVEAAFRDYARFTDLRVTAIYGGVGYGKQREDLKRGVDILVATPGRLQDHLEQRTATLRGIEVLVLDEVDRMLDMGFLPAVRKLVEACPPKRQTLFFSATLPPEIERLTQWAVRKDAQVIEIGARRSPAETVTHAFYPVPSAQKFDLLAAILEKTSHESVLIFTRTKDGADRIAKRLKTAHHTVGVLHSNRSQNQRVEALEGFKSGKYDIMVATDIAARGIDVAGVTHVINYDIPKHPEDYVHRIGRTGRAQREGDAFTLITGEDADAATAVERYLGQRVERLRLDGFAYGQESAAVSAPASSRSVAPRRSFGSPARSRRPRGRR